MANFPPLATSSAGDNFNFHLNKLKDFSSQIAASQMNRFAKSVPRGGGAGGGVNINKSGRYVDLRGKELSANNSGKINKIPL